MYVICVYYKFMCMPYVYIVSVCVSQVLGHVRFRILKSYFIDELQINKVTVYLVIFTTALQSRVL